MSASKTSLGIDRLTTAERLRLVEEIRDSIADDPASVPLTDARCEDLQRRLDACRDDPKVSSSWEDVKARLRGRA